MGTACKQAVGKLPPDPVDTRFVRDMHDKLKKWSLNDRNIKFDDLWNLVCNRRTLREAWRRLKRNKGKRTPGIDGLTFKMIENSIGGAAMFVEETLTMLQDGKYKPSPVNRRWIPKRGKPDKLRPLGIPTVKDRLVQMTLLIMLEPIFEADFYPTSYGFRPKRNAFKAISEITSILKTEATPGSCWVIEGDIRACFDRIDRHLLMMAIRKRITDKRILRLILSFLKAGVMEDGWIEKPVTGTPQGGIISPLLANIYLTALDARYSTWTPNPHESAEDVKKRRTIHVTEGMPTFYIVRYADDFVVLAHATKAQAKQEKTALKEFLWSELKLELSEEKTFISDPRDGIRFLGYDIQGIGDNISLTIPPDKVLEAENFIKDTIHKATIKQQGITELTKVLNSKIAGWAAYFKYAHNATGIFRMLDEALMTKMQIWLSEVFPHMKWGAIREKYFLETPHGQTIRSGKARLRLFSQTTMATLPMSRQAKDSKAYRGECR